MVMDCLLQARVLHACELIRRQCYLEAAAHLARAATCADFHLARRLLVQVGVLGHVSTVPLTPRFYLSQAVL